MKRVSLMLVCGVLAVAAGCASTTGVLKAEQDLRTAEETAKLEEQVVKQREAELKAKEAELAAAQKTAQAKLEAKLAAEKALGTAKLADAKDRLKLIESMVAGAQQQVEEACKLNPELPECKKAEPPPVQPAPEPPAPVTFDVKLEGFDDLTQVVKLTKKSAGWDVEFLKGQWLKVTAPGNHPVVVWKANVSSFPTCIRFKADGTHATFPCP